MKMFLFALIATMTFTASALINPVNRSTNLKYDGTVVSGSLEQHFINVKNTSGSSVAIGQVMVLDLTADNGFSATTSTSDLQAPICVMAVTCAADALCKCQKYGYFSAALFDVGSGPATAGKKAFLSAGAAGYVKAINSPSATDYPVGIFYDAAAATGSVELFIQL